MSTAQLENPQTENPYKAPFDVEDKSEKVSEQSKSPSVVSGLIAGAGVFVLFFGYAISTFAVIDLYLPSNPIFSEIIGTSLSPITLWGIYGIAVATAGTLMICSRPIPMTILVAYVMCPLLAVAYAMGSPLRVAKKWAIPIAAIYLAIGTCCGAFAIPRMVAYYAIRDTDEALGALGFHLLLITGVACVAGAVAKLMSIPSGGLMHNQFETE